jgi:predicted nucleotidyltransferase
MMNNKRILVKIKELVKAMEPTATIILFGSHARGQDSKNSDFDILILIDNDVITYTDEQRIKYPLYDLEFETGKIISPLIFSRHAWETKHSITPFYRQVKKDGIQL